MHATVLLDVRACLVGYDRQDKTKVGLEAGQRQQTRLSGRAMSCVLRPSADGSSAPPLYIIEGQQGTQEGMRIMLEMQQNGYRVKNEPFVMGGKSSSGRGP